MILSSPYTLSTPKKIISLVPSITELLFHLGLEVETIGITKFCVHPKKWFQSKTRIGGTKNVNIEKIISLNPDLILCNKEENVQAQIEVLATKSQLYLCDIQNYDDALKMIEEIGILCNKVTESSNIIKNIEVAFNQNTIEKTKEIKTTYLIWKEPYMTVGGDTFISSMMQKAGLTNIYAHENRYPQKTIQEMQDDKPELILLSSEPYPFKEKHLQQLQKHFPNTIIALADGEMFSWYGSRMEQASIYLKQLKQSIQFK